MATNRTLRWMFESDSNFLGISLGGYPLSVEIHPLYGNPSLFIRSGWSDARQQEPIISKFFHDFPNLFKKNKESKGVTWMLNLDGDETKQSQNLHAFLLGIKAMTDSALLMEGVFTVWEDKLDQMKSLNEKLSTYLFDERKSYVRGAAAGALRGGELSEQLPSEISEHVGSFLDRKDGVRLARTRKDAAKTAQEEELKEKRPTPTPKK